MRIAIFTDSFLPQVNGVVTGTMNLVENLSRHEFLIVAPKPKEQVSWKPKNAGIVFVSPSACLPTYKDYRICFFVSPSKIKLIEAFKPDLVFCQTPFTLGNAGIEFARKNNLPLIGNYNTLLPDFLVYLPLPLIKNTEFAKKAAWDFGNAFYNKCDLVIAPSNAMLAELEKHGLKQKTKKILYGIPEEFFKAGKKARKDRELFTLAFFGRLGFEKNIQVVLDAFALLEKKFPNLRLALIGDGPARKTLEEIAESKGIRGKVEFAGWVIGRKRAEKIASCNLLVTASTIETQGITTFEALGAGLPVIAARALANPEAVKDAFNGFLFRPFDSVDCAERIERILNSKLLYKKLSKNALIFAKRFTWKKIAKEFEEAFKEEIARKQGSD
jgi:glycosyltransferase involved in cell wall biosynthesis